MLCSVLGDGLLLLLYVLCCIYLGILILFLFFLKINGKKAGMFLFFRK